MSMILYRKESIIYPIYSAINPITKPRVEKSGDAKINAKNTTKAILSIMRLLCNSFSIVFIFSFFDVCHFPT